MAIGTALAIGLGSAVIGGGASLIGSKKNSKAINRASDAQAEGNAAAIAAQEKARSENLALQQPIYDAGMPALNARNALLGLGGPAQQPQQTQAQPNAFSQFQGGLTSAQRYGAGALGPYGTFGGLGDLSNFNDYWTQMSQQQQPAAQTTAQPFQDPQAAANDAFDTFRNSSGYQFRLNQGYDAINSGYAGAGTLQSGAAMKGITEYGQDFASNEFGNYMAQLGQQQNLTTGAANAMAGVNSTYANNAGNLAIQNGQNIGNAAVAKANNSNALLGSLAGGLGGVLGSIGG